MYKKIIIFSLALIIAFVGYFTFRVQEQSKIDKVTKELDLCRIQNSDNSSKCKIPTSTIELRPANVPDRKIGWPSFSVPDYYSLTFRHPADKKVVVEGGAGDVIIHRVRIGTVMILEAVTSGAEGVAGDNPADYERLVYNSIAQNTQPNWINYNPGYSAEKFGDVTLYNFHTNILDAFASLDLTIAPSSNGLPLQGVLFDPSHGIDWLVYFQKKDDVMASDVLRTVSFTQ
jgi:hypothetical protein